MARNPSANASISPALPIKKFLDCLVSKTKSALISLYLLDHCYAVTLRFPRG
jgi:hypothetical protein